MMKAAMPIIRFMVTCLSARRAITRRTGGQLQSQSGHCSMLNKIWAIVGGRGFRDSSERHIVEGSGTRVSKLAESQCFGTGTSKTPPDAGGGKSYMMQDGECDHPRRWRELRLKRWVRAIAPPNIEPKKRDHWVHQETRFSTEHPSCEPRRPIEAHV